MRGVSFEDWRGALQKRREQKISEARATYEDEVASAKSKLDTEVETAKGEYELGKSSITTMEAILSGKPLNSPAPEPERVVAVRRQVRNANPKAGRYDDIDAEVLAACQRFRPGQKFCAIDVRQNMRHYGDHKFVNISLRKLVGHGTLKKVGMVPIREWRQRSPGAAGAWLMLSGKQARTEPRKALPAPPRAAKKILSQINGNSTVSEKVKTILEQWKKRGVVEFTVSDLRYKFPSSVPTGTLSSALKVAVNSGMTRAVRFMTSEEYKERYHQSAARPPIIYEFIKAAPKPQPEPENIPQPPREEDTLPRPINRIDLLEAVKPDERMEESDTVLTT